MEVPGSLSSLNSMSKSSREGPKDNPASQIQNSEKVVSTNLNTNSALASKDITQTEGDRLEKVARKRKGLHKIQTSKRRRLRPSSSNLSTKKEWPLTKPIEGPTNIPFPSDPGVVAVRKNSQDLAEKREAPLSANLAANREILAPKREGSCRKEIFKKSNRVVNGGETGAGSEGEREGSSDHQAAHSERAKSVGSPPSSRAGEQSGSGNQCTPESRVLRPRRKITTTAQSSRVLQVVALSLADYTRIIGRRIKVFWPIDAQWYYGWVKEYDAAQKLHLVVYDDHEQEWLALQKEKFKLQVFPGETFGILGPTRSASSAAHPPDQPEVVSTRDCRKTARRWNGVKDGNAIGDDLLLSAVVPRGRLGGKFLKGLSNGTSTAIIPFPRTDGIVKESASPVSSILRDKSRSGKVPAVGGERENYGGGQTVPSNPIAEGQKRARKVETSVAEYHMASLSEKNSVLSRDACSDQAVKSNDVGDAHLGKSDLVYFRRHINRSKVRASSVALVDGLLGAVGRGSQQEQPVKIVNGLQIQTFERASVVPLEGEVNRSETLCGRDMGNVVGVGDETCREANTAREQNQHIVSMTHSFSVNNKSPTSSPLTFQEADLAIFNDGTALWEEKISLGYRSRNVSLSADVKVLGNRVYPLNIATSPSLTRAKANSLRHQRGLEFQQHAKRARASKASLNSSQLYLPRVFHSSLHLVRLDVVVLDLFTWHLFNILKEMGFCDGVSFEERFYANGSLRDLVNIIRLLFTIVKAVPLSDWVHRTSPLHWQGRILWELWNVLSGTSLLFAELSGVLVAKVEGLLVRHLQHLILEASRGSGMTFRQIFNILVCYFIKPYVIATICEKGALVTVVIQRFLLSERSNSPLVGGIECVRQSVRAVRLRSGADGDLRFFSYLKYFPVSEDWCTENGLSQKQVKTWIPTTACTSHVEQSSDKLFKQQGLQVTTVHVVTKKFGSDSAGNDVHLELNGDNVYRLLKSVLDRFRLPGEGKYWALNGRSGFHTNSCKPLDFFSGLILTSMLQKCLLSAGVKNLSSLLSTENRIGQINTNGGVPTEVVMSSLYKVGRKVSSNNPRMSVKDCRHGAFQEDHAVEMETEARQEGFGSKLSVGMSGGKISANRERNVADPSISAGNTSSTMGNSMFGSENHEGGMEINWLQSREDDGSLLLQGSGKETPQCPSLKDSFTCGSANLSFERTLGPRSAEDGGLEFRPQLNSDRCFDQRAKEPSREPKMASYQSRVLDRRKRKRGIPKLVSPAYNDVSHLGGRRYGKRGRPSRQSRQDMVADQRPHYCCANLLVTKGDRGWRESDVRVELQPNGSECLIVVQGAGDKLYAHKVQQMRLTSMTNRYTHARVWKGSSGWSLEFCDRKQWNLFKVLYEECGHQNARAASVKQIPIPGVRQIQDFDVTDLGVSPFVRPSLGYICQTDGEVEAAHKSTCIIYDLDSEDEAWLAEVNENFDDCEHGSSNLRITEDCLERIIDRLEKFTHMKAEELVSPDDAVGFCQDQGPADVVRAVYTHWCKKRLWKGTALVRQFQPPLWEQYDKQLQKWQASLNELQMHLPSASKEQLLERCPRPPMFAFCLRPRGLDANNMSKKMQKQRSQRKLSSVARTAIFAETAEVPMYWPHRRQIHHHLTNSSTDPDWQPPRTRLVIPARCIKPVWQNNALRDADHDQPVSGLNRQAAGMDSFTKAEEARSRAAEARERAGVKAGKSQRLFLKFDSALHRAVAALVEYEAIQFAEMALADEEAEVCSPPALNEQLSDLKERVGHLSSQLSNLSEKSYDSGSVIKDESCGSLPDSGAARHCDDGDDIYRVYSQNDEFEGSDTKHGFMGYSDALLPMPAWGHLDAWMGTTLLQRTDEGNTSQHIL